MKCGKCGAELENRRFEYRGFLLCEGPSDVAVFRKLLEARGGPTIHIRCAGELGQGSGRDSFGRALRAAHTTTGFIDSVRHIVVATDCDGDKDASFAAVKSQLEELQWPPVPVAPDVTETKDGISLTVMMVPTGAPTGSLETLAYVAAASANAVNAAAVESFANATGVDAWAPQKQAKMKVRSFLACTHQPRPDIGLGHLWTQQAGHLVPLSHPVFTPLFDRIVALFP